MSCNSLQGNFVIGTICENALESPVRTVVDGSHRAIGIKRLQTGKQQVGNRRDFSGRTGNRCAAGNANLQNLIISFRVRFGSGLRHSKRDSHTGHEARSGQKAVKKAVSRKAIDLRQVQKMVKFQPGTHRYGGFRRHDCQTIGETREAPTPELWLSNFSSEALPSPSFWTRTRRYSCRSLMVNGKTSRYACWSETGARFPAWKAAQAAPTARMSQAETGCPAIQKLFAANLTAGERFTRLNRYFHNQSTQRLNSSLNMIFFANGNARYGQ